MSDIVRHGLWNKLIKIPDTRLVKRVFLADCNANKPNTWATDVKKIRNLIYVKEKYNEKSFIDIDAARRSISYSENIERSNIVQSKPKLRTYKIFKTTYETEPNVTS